MAHNGSDDPMASCTPLTLQFPVSGQQQVWWTQHPSVPESGLPVTIEAHETRSEDNGLTRTIVLRFTQSPPAFRSQLKTLHKSKEVRYKPKTRTWTHILANERQRIKELAKELGPSWKVIAERLEAEGFPARHRSTIAKLGWKLIQEEQDKLVSEVVSSTDKDEPAQVSAV